MKNASQALTDMIKLLDAGRANVTISAQRMPIKLAMYPPDSVCAMTISVDGSALNVGQDITENRSARNARAIQLV